MQIRLTQLLSNNNVTGSDVIVTDVSGPLGYITKQATVDKLAKYITGSIVDLNLNNLSASTIQTTVITASIISASTYVGIIGGGGGDVTLSGSNNFTGINTFNNNYVTVSLGITGSDAKFTTITGTYISGVYGNFSHISASSATFSGSILLYGTAALAENPDAAYIVYSSSIDKLVAFPGLFVSGALTASSHISATSGYFSTLVNTQNLQTKTFSTSILKITGNYDLSTDLDRHIIFINANFGEVTASLPLASVVPHRQYIFKKTDSSIYGVTILSPYETIDGASYKELLVQYETLTIISDGTGSWFVL